MSLRRALILALAAAGCASARASLGDGSLGSADAREPGGDDGGGDHDANVNPAADASSAVTGTCGGDTCRSGETCVATTCQYIGCSGAQVPGDYSSVQAAVTALSAAGGTICVGAGAWPATVTITVGTATLVIRGVSATQTTIGGFDITEDGPSGGTVSIEGAAISSVSASFSGTLDLTNCAIATSTSPAVALQVGYGQHMTVGVTSSRIAVTGANAIGIEAHNGYVGGDTLALSVASVDLSAFYALSADTIASLDVESSYIHDSNYGVLSTAFSSTVIANSFVRDATALSLTGTSQGAVAFAYYNNLFTNSGTIAVTSQLGSAGGTVHFGNSCFWSNATNFGGTAVDGTGDVKADPQMDTSSPPRLGTGSPCRGAGDGTHVPATDYWGNAWSNPPDIGAVQSL